MDELVGEFIEETTESLAALDNELLRLESNPDDAELVGSIFRLVHTVKGTCGFLGLPRLESVAHAGENVLGKVRDKALKATPDVVSIILEALDCIKGLIEHLAQNGAEPEGDDSDLIHRLNVMAGMEGEAGEAAAGAFAEALESIGEAGPQAEEPASEPAQESPQPAEAEPGTGMAVVPSEEVSDEAKALAVEEGLKADVKGKGAAKGGGAAAGGQSIRVNIDVLEELMQSVSELVLTRNQLSQMIREHSDSAFLTPIQRLSHITTELQEGIMKTRMQPVGNAWAKLPRIVRDLSMELGKKVRLQMIGEETELDRQLSEVIKDPLTHMVRNSVDHGLEKPEVRAAAGKPEEGTVSISAYHEGGHIIIEVTDDGAGINPEKIKAKAVEKGLATPQEAAEMSDQRALQFIFAAGFSTAEKVTNISGRGVGMDVVRSNIESIGGTVELSSTVGKGSRFKIKIPLTLAIVSVLIVESGGYRLAMPQINVVEMVHVRPNSGYSIEMLNRSPVMRLRNKLLPLVCLSKVLGLQSAEDDRFLKNAYVVICNVGGFDFGVVVDRVYDTEEIVVKPVAPLLQHISIYGGCTILGDGSVIMILDPNGLANSTGDMHLESGKTVTEELHHEKFSQKQIGFLLFRSGGSDVQRAVPLDLVARLEEIKKDDVEFQSSGIPVVQYRGSLMRLITLEGNGLGEADESGLYQVIVFNYDGRMIGLVIDEIIDTVQERLDIKMPSGDKKTIGSMVFNGRTTEIVDTGYILTETIGQMLVANDDGPPREAGGRTILLVDDSPFFRNLNAPYLSACGFSVLTAEGPDEAFRIMERSDRIDLIISDIEMPEVNGIQFAERCRGDKTYQNIPMIAYTSNMKADMVQKGMAAGFRAYVSKTDREGLLREVSSLLG